MNINPINDEQSTAVLNANADASSVTRTSQPFGANAGNNPEYPAWTSETSVDSIRVQFDCELHETPPRQFRVRQDKPSAIRRRNCILWQENGRDVFGREATAVQNGFVFHITRFGPNQPLTISVWCSIPQWCHGHNCGTASAQDIVNVVEAMRSECLALGIETSTTARICELHVMRNIVPPRPIESYWPILQAVEPPYSRNSRNFATTIERGTKRTRWSIYDKAAQVRRNAQKPHKPKINGRINRQPDIGSVENMLRFEYRVRRIEKIREEFGFSTVAELMNDCGSLARTMDKVLKRDLFRDARLSSRELEAIENYGCEYRAHPGIAREDIERYLTPGVSLQNAFLTQGYARNQVEVSPRKLKAITTASYTHSGNDKGQRASWNRGKTVIRLTRMHSLMEDGTPWAQLYNELSDVALANPS